MAEDLQKCPISMETRRHLGMRAVRRVRVDFLNSVLEVGFDDARAAERFARRYARFKSEGPVCERAFAIRSGDATFFWYEGRPGYRWPARDLDASEIDFLTDSVVRREFFGTREDTLTFHAAAIEIERGALAIVAPSTGGKTTTAIACARRGMRLFTDEECVIREGRVAPFPRAINLRADGIERILADPTFEDYGIRDRLVPHRGTSWSCVGFDELFGREALPEPQPLVGIYFIRSGGPPASIEPMTRTEALPLFLAAWPRSKRVGVDRVADVLQLMSVAPPSALRLGTPDETALVLQRAGRSYG